jgi:hypothetical protein
VGPDLISNKMLIVIKNETALPLSMLFNKSLKLGVFPSDWKMSHAIPLFKKGDNSLVSNYRPVAMLCCISKVLEEIVYKHLYNHLHQNLLLYKFQSVFLPGHSTNHQHLTSVTFCDICRAFDRVWIRGLLLKLKRYGIKDTLLRWLNSYLENRNQRVVLKYGISEAGNLRAGVPHGSVLDPLLNPAGTPGYRNGTESFFGLKGRPSVVRDVKIHNQPVLRMRRK